MRILIIVGSNHNPHMSSSYKISAMVKEAFEKKEAEVEIVSLNEYHIEMCKGCCQCFQTGKCIVKDDTLEIKEKMIKADHIIFVTPVYAHNVTGLLKNFIDRTSNWLHIFGLLGKTSSTIIVSSTNGNVYVSDYLKKTLEFYGTVYIGNLNITVDSPKMFEDERMLNIILRKHLKNIIEYDRDKIDLDNVEKQSGIFLSFKKMYTTKDLVRTYEEEVWMTDSALKKNSFIEAYDERRRTCRNEG